MLKWNRNLRSKKKRLHYFESNLSNNLLTRKLPLKCLRLHSPHLAWISSQIVDLNLLVRTHFLSIKNCSKIQYLMMSIVQHLRCQGKILLSQCQLRVEINPERMSCIGIVCLLLTKRFQTQCSSLKEAVLNWKRLRHELEIQMKSLSQWVELSEV